MLLTPTLQSGLDLWALAGACALLSLQLSRMLIRCKIDGYSNSAAINTLQKENLHLSATGDASKVDTSAGCRSEFSAANLYSSLFPDKSQ